MYYLRMIKKHLALLIIALCTAVLANAQQEFDFNIFNGEGEIRSIYVQRHRINDKYTLNLDGRAHIGLGSNVWTRWGIRGNIQRKLSDKYSIDLGFMYNYVNYPDFTRQEFRPHQAFHINHLIFSSSALKHRFRLEERLFTHVHDDVLNFKIRFRYRISNQGRFNSRPITPKSFFYRTSAEFNFNIYNEADDVFWVRGRYCAGYGYQFSSKLSMDVNYNFEHNKIDRDIKHNTMHIFQITLRQTLYWQN